MVTTRRGRPAAAHARQINRHPYGRKFFEKTGRCRGSTQRKAQNTDGKNDTKTWPAAVTWARSAANPPWRLGVAATLAVQLAAARGPAASAPLKFPHGVGERCRRSRSERRRRLPSARCRRWRSRVHAFLLESLSRPRRTLLRTNLRQVEHVVCVPFCCEHSRLLQALRLVDGYETLERNAAEHLNVPFGSCCPGFACCSSGVAVVRVVGRVRALRWSGPRAVCDLQLAAADGVAPDRVVGAGAAPSGWGQAFPSATLHSPTSRADLWHT